MKRCLKMLLAASLCLAVHWALPAAEEPSSASARLPFFAFQNGLPGPPLQSAALLKELGYDGLSASGYEVAPWITALKANNVKLYNTYLTLELDAATNALTEPMRQLIDTLQGTDAALWIAIIKVTQDGKTMLKSAPDGDAIALARLREILAYAEPRGIKMALYPHTGFWLERIEDAMRLADKLNRPNVGTTFNLCHWLKVEGNRDPILVLKAALPRLLFVSINGADTGDTRTYDWDRLIQTLDRGSYDVATLIHQLRTLGYTGSVGLQCYNLKGDSRENLTRSMSAWKRMFEGSQTASSAEKTDTAITVDTNLNYKAEPSLTDYEVERCKLDLYLPKTTAEFATLVWFHGGALQTGSKDDEFNVRIARRFAQLGVAVALVNYRLSPKIHYPGYVDDAAAAFAWVRQHIAQYGGDSHKVFVGGHSAGGYLTYMIGLDDRYLRRHGLETSAIAGLIPVSGQTMTHYTIREERGLNKEAIIADEAAPIHYLRKNTPPLLVFYAEHDMAARMEENQYLVAALKATGNERVTQQLIRDRDHGSIAGNMYRPGDPAAQAILSFIHSTTAKKESTALEHTPHPEAQWFANAGLGLFIHYGLSSVDGRVDLSWGMMADTPWDKGAFKLTPEAYFKLAERFQPEHYEPFLWLRAAKQAGFHYAVMTTKHHEGFALWPSAYGEFNTKQFMGGRDLVKIYVEACRQNGLKVGLYYSPPDWYYNREHMSFRYRNANQTNYVPYGLKHEPITLHKQTAEDQRRWDQDYRAYLHGQIEELLTRYGRIDLLWFDGGPEAISIERIRELQPGIVINPRMHGTADFATAEVEFPKQRPAGWWEMCSIWNSGGWGYTSGERYRSTESVLEEFSRVRAWGGNYLINVGPRANGELPEIAYQRLAELGNWMQHSSSAVMDTQAGGWPEDSNVPYTIKDNLRYLLVPSQFKKPVEFRCAVRPQVVRLLRTGESINYRYANSDQVGVLSFELVHNQRSGLMDAVLVVLP